MAENPDFDHEFEPTQECVNCNEMEDDCECDESDLVDTDECAICGMSESDETHQEEL